MRVERVDATLFAESASRVLREAWEPTCIDYTPEYLRWQFRSPGEQPSIGVAAFDGDEVVGFIASVPRRLRLGADRFEARLFSFLAVRPAWRGLHAAGFLYEALLDEANGPRGPVVVFAQPQTVAERVLLTQLQAKGYRAVSLGACRNHMGRAGREETGYTCVEALDRPTEYLEVVEARVGDAGRLLTDPGLEGPAHNATDPRGRTDAVVLGPGGGPVGVASVGVSEIVSPTGLETIATLEGLFLSEPAAPVLRALTRFAIERWDGRLTSRIVSIPNVQGIDPGALSAAGVRATPAVFHCHLFVPEESPSPVASSTNLEVV